MCELALLYTTRGHLCCADLKPLLREAWGCDELIPGVMFEIVCDKREAFKHTSNQGGIWWKQKSTDAGNFAYALLYILMMEDALDNKDAPYGVPRMYRHLMERYEALELKLANLGV